MASVKLDGLSAAFKEIMLANLNAPPVPARHQTRDEYEAALRFALAMGWRNPLANHAGRWFTFANDPKICRIAHVGDRRHHCKDMDEKGTG